MSASLSISLIRHRLAEAHAGLRTASFMLAAVVTLGCVVLLVFGMLAPQVAEIAYFTSVPWRGQAVLITRPDDEVLSCETDAAGCAFIDPANVAGTVCLSFAGSDPYPIYAGLNEGGVHTKCVKARLAGGRELRVLRFGFPFYESRERVGEAAGRVAIAISRGSGRT